MKKNILLLFILSGLLLSCHHAEKEAEAVAYGYLTAMANYKVDEAKQYATVETCQETLAIAEKMVAMVDTAYIMADTPAKIEITELVLENDTAALVKYVKNTPLKHHQQGELRLVRRDNRWLANDLLK